jgi:hypothetical protein
MARSIKRLDPCRQGLQSISQEVEVISVPLNLVAYPGEIWLVSGSLSQHFVWFDYSPLDNAYGRPVSLHCRILARADTGHARCSIAAVQNAVLTLALSGTQ